MRYTDLESGVDYRAVHKRGMEAAQAAAKAENDRLGAEGSRGFDCGFAWVQLTPGTHPYVRTLKSLNVGDKHWAKGWGIWASGMHDVPTQSISVHQAAARAYVDAVTAARIGGLEASAGSRYD